MRVAAMYIYIVPVLVLGWRICTGINCYSGGTSTACCMQSFRVPHGTTAAAAVSFMSCFCQELRLELRIGPMRCHLRYKDGTVRTACFGVSSRWEGERKKKSRRLAEGVIAELKASKPCFKTFTSNFLLEYYRTKIFKNNIRKSSFHARE